MRRHTFMLVAAIVAVTALATPASAVGDAKAVRGGSFTYSFTIQPRTMDPLLLDGTSSNSSATLLALAYDTLLYVDPATQEYVYRIAESLTTKDATNWTLKLRPRVKFTDGTAFDAAAVKAQWDRVAAPANASSQLAAAAQIASTTVVDPATLTIALKAPNAVFPRVVASSLEFIPSPTAVAKFGSSYGTSPATTVGAGPFVLKTWERDAQMVYDRNSSYWDSPRPYLDAITVRQVPDEEARFNSLQTGGTTASFSIQPNWASRVKGAGLPVASASLSNITWLYLNLGRAPFNDVRVRRAFAMAIDPDQLNQVRYNGAGTVSRTIFSPDSTWYVASAKVPKFNHRAAQALFDEVARVSGKPVEITLLASPNLLPGAEQIQALFASYSNVKISISQVAAASYFQTMAGGSFDGAFVGSPTGDPDSIYDYYATGGARNYGKVSNPALDRALNDGRAATDLKGRQQAYATMQRVMVEQVLAGFLPVIPVAGGVGYQRNVRDVTLATYGPRFENIWLAKQK